MYKYRVIIDGFYEDFDCDCESDAIECAKECWEIAGYEVEDIEEIKVRMLRL